MDNVQTQPENVTDETEKLYRVKILRTLKIYPEISPSMLHIGIGPSSPGIVWKPVLETLIREGLVVRELKLVDGKTYTVIHLPKPTETVPTLKNV